MTLAIEAVDTSGETLMHLVLPEGTRVLLSDVTGLAMDLNAAVGAEAVLVLNTKSGAELRVSVPARLLPELRLLATEAERRSQTARSPG